MLSARPHKLHLVTNTESDRCQVGIVLQDTFLFAGTVADNIRYGRLYATEDEVIEAAQIANAHPFIQGLLHGYQAEVTGRGGKFSQGQRQLIAIARAVMANPSTLILDEATRSVDTRTERSIQAAMQRRMIGRTSIVRRADQILVIDRGEIIDCGHA